MNKRMRSWFNKVILVSIGTIAFKCSLSATYYVNDNSTIGDIYCTAVGSSGNSGTSPSSPKALLSQIITTYALTANDVVYVDKGTYTDAITFTSSDQGSASGYLKIIGAGRTNTIINCNIGANTVYFNDADYILFEGFTLNMTTAGSYQTTLYIAKSSDYNIIKDCKIESTRNSTFTSGSVDLNFALGVGSTSSILIPKFNVFQDNIIDAARYGLYFKGHSATSSEMADGNIFDGNTFTFSSVPTSGTFSPSNYIYYTKNTIFQRNKFQNFFTGLFLGISTGTNNENINLKIFNNYFSTDATVSDIYCGIHIKNPNTAAADIRIYNNTFYFKNGSFGCVHFESANSSQGVKLYNNLFFVPSSASPTTSYSTLITFDNSAPAKLDSADYNYYNPGLYDIACRGTTCYNTLALFKAYDHDNRASKNGDENSLSDADFSDPLLVAPNSHNLDLQASSAMFAKAPAIWGIDRDINSFARPTVGSTPIAIGADDNGSTYLPVKLLKFYVSKHNRSNQLNWITLSEINNLGFYIEKSFNGLDFETLAFVQGFGNSNEPKLYYYEDKEEENSLKKSTFYRLKQVDFDGKFAYSEIKVVNRENNTHWINLTSNWLTPGQELVLKLEDETTFPINIELLSADGKIIHQANWRNNTKLYTIPLNTFSAGVYIVKATSNSGNTECFPFVVSNH